MSVVSLLHKDSRGYRIVEVAWPAPFAFQKESGNQPFIALNDN